MGGRSDVETLPESANSEDGARWERRKNAAAMTKIKPNPVRSHHLYLLSGSGVSIGAPNPMPGLVSVAGAVEGAVG